MLVDIVFQGAVYALPYFLDTIMTALKKNENVSVCLKMLLGICKARKYTRVDSDTFD